MQSYKNLLMTKTSMIIISPHNPTETDSTIYKRQTGLKTIQLIVNVI